MISGFLGGLFPFVLGTAVAQLLMPEPYDYCDPKLKLCEVVSDHTMCKYPVSGLSSQCTPTIQEPLSAIEKKRILFWHNMFRSNVANGTERNKNRKLPTASNMRQIYWDKELETIATRWAEQCASSTLPRVYDKCRNTKRFQVSQNVGMRKANGSSIDKQAPQIIITWYKESKDFNPNLIDKFYPDDEDKTSTKHFANIIWADTYAIGCARVIFQEQLPLNDKEPQKTSVWTIERLVCNYGPGGNEIGKAMYKRGASCESCPGGTHCSRVFPGLCAIQSAEKLEAAPNPENQDPKEETRTETETSPPEMDFSSSSGVPGNETMRTEEILLEEDEEDNQFSPKNFFPEEETQNVKKTPTGSFGKKKGPGIKSPEDLDKRFNEIIESSKPTARKKSQRFKKEVLSRENETQLFSKENEWTDGTRRKRMGSGRSFQCYESVDTRKIASSQKKNPFPSSLLSCSLAAFYFVFKFQII